MRTGDVRELLRVRDVRDGVVDTGDVLLRILSMEGVRYDLLSDEERRRVDQGLLALVAGVDFPFKVWVTNRPLDVHREIERMADLAAAWNEGGSEGLGVLCRGIGQVLSSWQERELPERLLFVSTWVKRGDGSRQSMLAELDRRLEHLRRALPDAVPGAEVRVLGTAGVLRALHGYWQKARHVRVRAEDLGARGETVLVVGRAAERGTGAGEDAEAED